MCAEFSRCANLRSHARPVAIPPFRHFLDGGHLEKRGHHICHIHKLLHCLSDSSRCEHSQIRHRDSPWLILTILSRLQRWSGQRRQRTFATAPEPLRSSLRAGKRSATAGCGSTAMWSPASRLFAISSRVCIYASEPNTSVGDPCSLRSIVSARERVTVLHCARSHLPFQQAMTSWSRKEKTCARCRSSTDAGSDGPRLPAFAVCKEPSNTTWPERCSAYALSFSE